MKILIILAHPNKKSFNSAIAETCINTAKKKKHTVVFHDLYREDFYPLLTYNEIQYPADFDETIEKHCKDLVDAEGLIIVHPNWWGQPPAILKGWIDRVIRSGVAYRFKQGDSGEGVPIGLLKTKVALVINTTDTPEEREKLVFGDPLDLIWRKCIFDFCGVSNVHRHTYGVIVTSTLEQRRKWLKEIEILVDELFN